MTVLRFEKISIRDKTQHFIRDFDLSIKPGEIVTLMGPSGSGKSTLLAYAAGFISRHFQASGAIHLDGKDLTQLPPEQRRVGLLFQDDLLLPHLNVQQNLFFGIRAKDAKGQKRSRAKKLTSVEHALKAAELPDFQKRRPATLSGGQRARIALIRTLLSEPQVLLLDEPFSKLDADLRLAFRAYVKREIETAGLPTLLVTHDRDDALAMEGPVLRIEGDGVIVPL